MKTQSAPAPLSTLEDVAAFAQCSQRTARRLYDRGIIPGIRLGTLLRFDLEAVSNALRKLAKGGRPSAR